MSQRIDWLNGWKMGRYSFVCIVGCRTASSLNFGMHHVVAAARLRNCKQAKLRMYRKTMLPMTDQFDDQQKV